MIEVDVRLPTDTVPQTIAGRVEEQCAAEAMVMAMRGTLGTYPGCTHWHYKRPGEPGTLEITWWPKNQRLWFKVADGREGPWIMPAITKVKAAFEARR